VSTFHWGEDFLEGTFGHEVTGLFAEMASSEFERGGWNRADDTVMSQKAEAALDDVSIRFIGGWRWLRIVRGSWRSVYQKSCGFGGVLSEHGSIELE